jgi:ABC-type transport system involved in multi-copper enzyme maturation permease subunit
MVLGPVFRAELIRTARRRVYYVLRMVYGSAILLMLWMNYQVLLEIALVRGGKASIADFADFAFRTFLWFMGVQLATILILVPPLFGGVIADEKQRKVMHYLMASRLSSAEIIVDKLAARLLHVGVFVLLGLPVMSLLTLFGGVALDYVLAGYAATCSITFFAASLAILISTFARRVRQAVLIVYILQMAWLIVPPLAEFVCRSLYPGAYLWFRPVNEWVLATDPAWLLLFSIRTVSPRPIGSGGGTGLLAAEFIWMVGLQLAVGVCFLVIAVWQLRPTFRRQEESARRFFGLGSKLRLPRWLRRPECGADAMLWKERHFARTDLFTKLVVLPATILLTVCVFLGGGFDETVVRACADITWQGYAGNSRARDELNDALRAISPIYVALWLLAVAGASASSVTYERERDTWDGLIASPLTGWEILRSKVVGAIWGLRGFGGLVSLFWLVGLAAGAIHPLGFLLALAITGLLTWFVTALGIRASLAARKTSRALTMTLVILVFLNVGYLGILLPVCMSFRNVWNQWWNWFPEVGCTPMLAAKALLKYPEVAQLMGAGRSAPPNPDLDRYHVACALVVLAGYAIATAVLSWRSLRCFDRVVGRPSRPADSPGRSPADSPGKSALPAGC